VYDTDSNMKLLFWSYGHLFLSASLVMFGVASKKVFAQNVEDAAKYLKDETRLLLTGALVMFFVAQAVINSGHDHTSTAYNHRVRILSFVGGAVVVAITGLVFTGLSSVVFTGLLTVVALILVGRSVAEARVLAASGDHH